MRLLLNTLKATLVLYVSVGFLYSFDMRLRLLIGTTDGYYINYEIIMSSDGCFKAMPYAKGQGTASVNASTILFGPLDYDIMRTLLHSSPWSLLRQLLNL